MRKIIIQKLPIRHNNIQLLQAVMGLICNHKEVVWKKVLLYGWIFLSVNFIDVLFSFSFQEGKINFDR